MKLKLYHVDAFARSVFTGNPAAVIVLDRWLDDEILQCIAEENNLSETAYVLNRDDEYSIRWFTPAREVDLCGHATLAAGHVLFNEIGISEQIITFHSNSGDLEVAREKDHLVLNFPKIASTLISRADLPTWLQESQSNEVYTSHQDLMVVFTSEQDILNFQPHTGINHLDHRGLIITAPGITHDFVSRTFYPELGIQEDPVTGSAHCQLAPYWANRLGKSELRAKQLSKRGGEILCRVDENRVFLKGRALTYLKGEIEI